MERLPSSIGYINNSTQPNQRSSSTKQPTARTESGGIHGSTQTRTQTQALDQFSQSHAQLNPDPDPIAQLETAAGASNSAIPQPQPQAEASSAIRYRECLKNHAASTGGNVTDGCGEFMPSGEEGTAEALKCAACECHRNFHRRETSSGGGGGIQYSQQFMSNYYYAHHPNDNNSVRNTANHHIQPPLNHHQLQLQHHQLSHHYSLNLASPATGPMMMAFGGAGRGAPESPSEDLNMFQYNADGVAQQMRVPPSYSVSKKRFRTKFSKEQKDRMHEVAEKLGWKIQKQDDEEVKQLCNELGIKRQVFKVWMHNNKQAMKKKQHDE